MRKKKKKETWKANLETTKVLRLEDKINEKQISLSRQQPSRPKLQKVIYKSFPHNFFSFFLLGTSLIKMCGPQVRINYLQLQLL